MSHKVLLVDDVSMFVELQKDFLQLSAVSIITACDGQQALRVCRSERPDLVCMDLHMPGMNGAECCKALKEDRQLSSTKVILITSEGKEGDRSLCLSAGCDDFLTKPLDRAIYLETARRQLPAIDRREKRVACHLRTKFRAHGVTLSGFLLDLSQNGAYLAADCQLERNAVVDLIFALPEPNGAIIQVRGQVAWINSKQSRQKSSLPEGFGIEFQNPPQETARALARFVEVELSLI